MHDLEILIPADVGKENIEKRFEDFKKVGLLNINDYDIKIVLATPPTNSDSLAENWDQRLTVEILKTPYHHVSQRIAYYYSDYVNPDNSRWFMRIDEDSLNNIDGIMKKLDSMYDHNGIYHIVAETEGDIHPIEAKILEGLGFSWWWENNGVLEHEWEISITSNFAMKSIINHDLCKKFLKIRQEIPTGYGDRALSYCARMLKIYPMRSVFLTKNPEILDFSIFGGIRHHIHEISHERNNVLLNYFKLFFDSEKDSNYSNQFCILKLEWNNFSEVIQLHPNKIVLCNKEKFGLWSSDNNTINMWLDFPNEIFKFKLDKDNYSEFNGNSIKIIDIPKPFEP